MLSIEDEWKANYSYKIVYTCTYIETPQIEDLILGHNNFNNSPLFPRTHLVSIRRWLSVLLYTHAFF